MCFLFLWALISIFCGTALVRLTQLSMSDERYSHLILIPLISVCLIAMNRRRVFAAARCNLKAGAVLIVLGAALYWTGAEVLYQHSDDGFAVSVLGVAAAWIGVFVCCYGEQAFRSAQFPLGCLVLLAPMPERFLDVAVAALQNASANTAGWLFQSAGVPVFRNGFIFSLPGADVEVASQCSGIRSGIGLLIIGGLAGYMGLRTNWARVVLVVCTVPIAVFKNAVRIVVIALLGTYVDADFLYGRLHRNSGIVFSVLGIGLLALVLFVLRRMEARRPKARNAATQVQLEFSSKALPTRR